MTSYSPGTSRTSFNNALKHGLHQRTGEQRLSSKSMTGVEHDGSNRHHFSLQRRFLDIQLLVKHRHFFQGFESFRFSTSPLSCLMKTLIEMLTFRVVKGTENYQLEPLIRPDKARQQSPVDEALLLPEHKDDESHNGMPLHRKLLSGSWLVVSRSRR